MKLYHGSVEYETGILTKSETIARLKVHPLFDQVSFHNQEVLANLKFVQFIEISNPD